ncbi:hypothetical protein EDD85DRAFT_583571 [Armillaria nabsnona]|nr:hypothetical protein EDD85DRAFT_583571 [Armillaria nabsnona]
MKTTPVGDSQCLLTNYLKRRLEHIPGFPRPVKMMGDKAYRISPTLHRGLGMFAARQFKMGDLVADERPLMVFPVGPPTDFDLATAKVPGENRIKLTLKSSDDDLSSIFERMSEESQQAFVGLQNSHLQNGLLFGTARTNGYGLEDDLKDETENVKFFSTLSSDNKMTELVKSRIGTYAGVFKDLSRVNHSCSPNVRRKFHMSTFSMQLRAARDIEEGEEIFTTYTQDLRPAADRAKGLAPYGIKCTCRACLDSAKSDPIRATVLNYSPPTLLPLPAGARDAAVQILARIEEEGLQASDVYHETLHDVFNAYAYARDEKNALMYGEKLWLANLAAGEPLYEMFRNAKLLKKSPPWVAGEFKEMPEHLISLFNAS